MEGNVRTLKTHPANDAAAIELKRHLDDLNAQYWRVSYLMEIYISVLEEEARQAGVEPDLRQVGEREEGMRKEYERACLTAQECLAEHQNMSDIRRGLPIGNNQEPRACCVPVWEHLCSSRSCASRSLASFLLSTNKRSVLYYNSIHAFV